jgi:PAS domain S-box-containing protein
MPNKRKQAVSSSIRLRLIISFTVVAAMAVGSACIGWISIGQSRDRVRSIMTETLPLVSSAQNLSSEVALFTVAVSEMPMLTHEWQRKELLFRLQGVIALIKDQLDGLQNSGFEPEIIKSLNRYHEQLINNLKTQSSIAQDFILIQDKLAAAVKGLREKQHRFIEISRPEIAAEQKEALAHGHMIGGSYIRELLATRKSDGSADLEKPEDVMQMGFETLVSSAAGEMRASLEVIGLTFQVAGLLHEAANVEKVQRVVELQQQFNGILTDILKNKVILDEFSSENRIMSSAMSIIDYGQGTNSIFALRERELDFRLNATQHMDNAILLSGKLSADANKLSESSKNLATIDSDKLNNVLLKAQSLQILAAIMAIFVSVAIGWSYVGRKVISRIVALQEAMERQAVGEDAAILSSGDDEISTMARSLQSFIEQRSQVEKELRRAIDSLNEAKQITKLGSFERNIASGRWQWSDVFYEIIGYREDELEGNEENFIGLVSTDDQQLIERFLDNAPAATETSQVTVRLIRKNGEVRTVHIFLKDSGKKGTDDHIQWGTVQDVTDRLKMEEELMQARKLESIGVLAGGIAHDYNNIMTGILGNVTFGVKLLGPNHPVTEYLKIAEKATYRARDLTEKLLTFAEGGGPVKSVSHLPELLEYATTFALSGSNVSCDMDIPEVLWPVEMDSGQIRQVIQNLILNADQAMPEGGVVKLSCCNFSMKSDNQMNMPAGSYVKIQVTDQGQGIEQKHLVKIFDPYFTTRQRDSTKGSGLGLAIARSIITKHNGIINVESELDLGTTFTMYIPALPVERLLPDPSEYPVTSGPVRVLVMDDELMIRDIAAQMVLHLGYEVVIAEDGEKAIELYESHHQSGMNVDVVIMDLTVPGGMGGKEAAEIIKSRYPEAKLVVSTGYSTDVVTENFRTYGFCDIISKPYNLKEFTEVLQRVLSAPPELMRNSG